MKKTALIIMILTIVSKIVGFAREISLSYLYGASYISDAYLISITIPGVIFGFIVAGLGAGYIPMYSKIQQIEGELEANRFTNNIINILFVIGTGVILIGFLFTEQIVRLFALGFEGETLALTVQFTKISLFSLYFTGMVSIFSGYLQIKGNYIIPALIGLPLNFFIILSIVISPFTDISVLAVGYVIAIGSSLFFMIPYMRKNKYRYKAILDFKDKHISNMAVIVMPLILGVSAGQINLMVDRSIASQLAVGAISAINFANRLNGFVQGIFVLSIATVLYPTISKMAAKGNMIGLKKSLSDAITGINLLVIPATIGSMVFATPIVSMLFGRGAFDSQAAYMTSSALLFYSLGMVGFGLRDILSRAFFSMQDTKTPMVNGVIGVVVNIILNIILSHYMGIGGLALATSIAAIFTTALLFISLRRKIGPFGMKHISISFFKILVASLIMGILAKVSFDYLIATFSQNLSLIIAIGVGAMSYFAIIYFMKIEDVDVFVNIVKRRSTVRGRL